MNTADSSAQQIARLSPERRQLLERLAQARNAAQPGAAIAPRKSGGQAALAYSQERLWIIDRLEPGNPLYNVFEAWQLRGVVNAAALKQALDLLLERHGVLRTRFSETASGLVQSQLPGVFPFEESDLSQLPAAARQAECENRLRTAIHRPFDLAEPPLARAVLLHVRDDDHILLIVMHHIASDGWSRAVFSRELSQAYAALLPGQKPDWAPLPIQYADYAVWQRSWLSGAVLEGQLGYWRGQLAELATLELPADRARPAQLSYRGDIERFELPGELTAGLKALARQHNATLYMVLLAAFQVLLMRYSGQQDIAVGTPVAGRNRPELEGLIGFFVNTLVMRGDLGGNPGFGELLGRTRQRALDAYAHQDLPFEKLVEELKPERDMSRNPLFQVMFALQNTPEAELRLAGLHSERLPLHNGTAKFDLSLALAESPSGLQGVLEYSSDLFDAARIRRLARHYRILLEGLVQAPDSPIWQLPLIDAAERRQLLHDWNATAVPYPAQLLQQRFEEQVRRSPGHPAVQFRRHSLGYAQLNARANRLAHHLRGLGIGADSLVGLCVERSLDMIVGMLAILKAGGAYVPLDPDYPQERLDFMLRDTHAAVVLTQSGFRERLSGSAAQLLSLDTDGAQWAGRPDSDPAAVASLDSLAYVVYTSGSTGQPKGVMVTQRGVMRLACNTNYVGWTPDDVVAQISNASFDAATFEIWGALLNGARLLVLPRETSLSPADFHAALQREGVSKLFMTTALFNEMVRSQPNVFECVQDVLFGGEASDIPSIRLALEAPPKRLLNVYGPTETTTFATWFEISALAEDAAIVPIGRPISNTECHVLDAHGNLVPVGVAGELYLGGAGLARGYLNRPELTAERFIASPFRPGERLYRSGDRVRWREDGVLEFLGRIDQQIKLRGYRIEPGEIEAVLQEDEAIRQSLVMVREDRPGDKRLVAYLVGQGIDAEAQRARLKGRLPDYMIPGALVVLDGLPLTPNGKVDRKALPALEQDAAATGYQPPRTPLETAIAAIWAETLNLPRVGIHDNFFDLGGHSLLAVQLMDRIHRAIGRKPHLNTLWFGAGSIAQQAQLLTEAADASGSAGPVLAMRTGGSEPALFCLHTIGGGNLFHYESMVRHLKGDRPVYGLQARGIDGNEAPDTSVEAMAQYCIESMRTLQPSGPYLLCGFSSGGLVAYEMARRLLQEGVEVQLFLLDSFVPNHAQSLSSSWHRWRRLIKQKKIRELQERTYYTVLNFLGLGRLRELRGMGESHRWAMWGYQPQGCDLPAHYFEASERIGGLTRPSEGWGPLLKGGLTLHLIPGAHGTMVKDANAVILADRLSACLPR